MRKKQGIIDNIMDNIRRVFQILNEQSQRIKQETGLTGPQLWAIRVIHQNGPINISDIAKRMYLHQTTVLGIIDRLEARDLVSRNRSKDDRRIIWVELTPDGNNLVKSVPEVVQGLLGANLEGISLQDLAEIDAGISQLVKIYGVQEIQPKPLFSLEINKKKKKGGMNMKKVLLAVLMISGLSIFAPHIYAQNVTPTQEQEFADAKGALEAARRAQAEKFAPSYVKQSLDFLNTAGSARSIPDPEGFSRASRMARAYAELAKAFAELNADVESLATTQEALLKAKAEIESLKK